MIENVSTQLTVFHCFAHCLLPGRAFASLYVLLFLEKEAEIGGRVVVGTMFHKQFLCYILSQIRGQTIMLLYHLELFHETSLVLRTMGRLFVANKKGQFG